MVWKMDMVRLPNNNAWTKSLNRPTVVDMIKSETACMIYKSINDLAQDCLSKMFAKSSHAVGKI